MITIPYQGSFNLYNTDFSPHANFVDFIQPKTFKKLRDEFPQDKLFKDEVPEYRKYGQRPHCRRFMCWGETQNSKYFKPYMIDLKILPDIWQQFCNYIVTNAEYRYFIRETLRVNDFKIRLDFHRTRKVLDVSPHIDSKGKIGSHLFYFMPKEWEDGDGGKTIFYRGKKVNRMNPEPQDFEDAVTCSVIGNRSCLFKNTEEGWHGVTQVKSSLDRQIFNLVILK